jgi:hypothetical protein
MWLVEVVRARKYPTSLVFYRHVLSTLVTGRVADAERALRILCEDMMEGDGLQPDGMTLLPVFRAIKRCKDPALLAELLVLAKQHGVSEAQLSLLDLLHLKDRMVMERVEEVWDEADSDSSSDDCDEAEAALERVGTAKDDAGGDGTPPKRNRFKKTS